jgi:long-chain acyl-CoA synthetase
MHARLPAAPGGRTTSYLPSAHIADRWFAPYHASMGLGASVTCVADPRTAAQHLAEVHPTIWGGVPRVWEKMKAALEAAGVREPAALAEEQRAAIRRKLGLDQAEWLVAGSAPTPVEVRVRPLAFACSTCRVSRSEDVIVGGVSGPIDGVSHRAFAKAVRSRPRSSGSSVSTYAWMPSRCAASSMAMSSRPRWVSAYRRRSSRR